MGTGAGVTVKALMCGQLPVEPFPVEITPHEVKASGAAAGSDGVAAPAAAVGPRYGVDVAIVVAVAGVIVPDDKA